MQNPNSTHHHSNGARLGRSVSLDQAAELLRVSRRTVYNRIKDGRLQTVRTIGGSQRVVVESMFGLGGRPQFTTTQPSPEVEGTNPVNN